MRREIAERLAATVCDGVGVEQTRRIVQEFLVQVVRCSLCDGVGTFTFGRDVSVDLTDRHGRVSEGAHIAAGTTSSCPRCDGAGDPDFVGWRCVRGDHELDCRRDKDAEGNGRREAHAGCGWRIMLPLVASEGQA